MAKNDHGLSRDVAPNIKYQIRKDDYFGCVHCGLGIYQYEHIDPEWIDAKEHDPKKMTLLCPTEHHKVTHYFTAKETVWKWKSNPWSKRNGHCHDKFDLDSDTFEIWIGATRVIGYESIITIDGECILAISTPEETGGTFQLSAKFYDSKNEPILEIINNEWKALSDAFDIVTSQGKIGIRKNGKFALKIFTFPPNKIVIEELDMLYNGMEIKADAKSFSLKTPTGATGKFDNVITMTAPKKNASLFTLSSQSEAITYGAGQYSNEPAERPFKNIVSHKCHRNDPCPCGKKKKYKDCCKTLYDYSL